jgi:uncharacterized protein YifN (PemK superfamily)
MNKLSSDTSAATSVATLTKEQLSATPAPIFSTVRPVINGAPLQEASEVRNQKIMVVAICRGQDGQLVITPIDVEHDTDDLTPMTADQMSARKLADQAFNSAQDVMMKALGALHEIFSRRLYRNQFRTFENFCFALYGTHRINDALMKKVHARARALKSDVNEGL